MTHIEYNPTLPFPAMLTPGELGRAWVDSLYHNDRATYDAMKAAGEIQPEAERIEAEAKWELVEIVRNSVGVKCPPNMLPDEFLTALQLQAREIIMADLRTPEPDPTDDDSIRLSSLVLTPSNLRACPPARPPRKKPTRSTS